MNCANCGTPIVEGEDGYVHIPTLSDRPCDDPTPFHCGGIVSDDGKDRDEYTWTDAGRGLALATRLTLQEAGDIVHFMKGTGRHPYDVLPDLVTLFSDRSMVERASALADLVKG